MTADQLPDGGTTPKEALSKEEKIKRRLSEMLDNFRQTILQPMESAGIKDSLVKLTLVNHPDFTLIAKMGVVGFNSPTREKWAPDLVMDVYTNPHQGQEDGKNEEKTQLPSVNETYWLNYHGLFTYWNHLNNDENCGTNSSLSSPEKIDAALGKAEQRLASFLDPIKAARAEQEDPRPQVQTDFYE